MRLMFCKVSSLVRGCAALRLAVAVMAIPMPDADDAGDNFYQLLQEAKDILPDNSWWVESEAVKRMRE